MSESNRNLSEVPALIIERKRYESWIESLEARRETTPLHVFERVQADYRTRLRRVAEQIASYRQAIEEERTNVDSRLSLLEAEERMRRDERAELELRAHVGELTGDDATLAFSTVDEAVARLVAEKEGLQARIAELDALLDVQDVPPEPTPVREPVAEPESSAPLAEPAPPIDDRESSVVRNAVEVPAEAPPPPAPPEPVVAEARSSAAMPAPVEEVAPEPTPVARDSSASGAQGDALVSPAPQSPRVSEPRTPSGTFDELKFLQTVVGRTTTAGREMTTLPENPRRASQPVRGLASPGGISTPNRPSAAVEQTKTLKCSECGAQNYPTEWYCERCGAELAAL